MIDRRITIRPFRLGQIVSTPGALAALRQADQTPLHFLTPTRWRRLGQRQPRRRSRKRYLHGAGLPNPVRLRPEDRHQHLDHHRGRPVFNLHSSTGGILGGTILKWKCDNGRAWRAA